MAFRVDPEILHKFSEVLAKDADGALRSQGYVQGSTGFDNDGFLVVDVAARHKEAVVAVIDSVKHLETICRLSGEEIRKSAELYANTDQGQVESLDQAYPR